MTLAEIMPLIYVAGFFILIMLCDSTINYLMKNSFIGPKYRLFVAPGVIIHELSHALAALFTFHKVEEINFFAPDGGYVVHQKTREPLSQVIISFAPIIGITLCFLLFTYLLAPNWLQPIHHPSFSSLWTILTGTSFSKWQTWLYIYLTISLATCLAPSLQDFKVAYPGILLISLILFLFSISSLHANLVHFLERGYLIALIILIFLLIAILLSLLFYCITKLIS